MNPKRVNRIKWSVMKMKWNGRLGAAHSFMGIKNYEEWAMGLTTPNEGAGLYSPETSSEWMSPEEFGELHEPVGLTPKEIVYEQAMAIKEQLEEAIANDEFEKCDALQQVLNILERKYNKL